MESLKPKTLTSDEQGNLYLPIYFKDYADLSMFHSQVVANFCFITELLMDDLSKNSAFEVGYALAGVSKILSQITSEMSEDFEMLEKIRTGDLIVRGK